MPRSVSWRWFVGLVILAIFVVWTERAVGWSRIVQAWRSVSLPAIGAALLLLVASYAARAARIQGAFAGATAGRFGGCLRIVLVHTFSNNFLPVRSGELAFPVLMSRLFAVPAAVSLPRLLWFRVLDAHLLVLVAGAGLLLPVWPRAAAVAVLLLWCTVPVLVFAARGPLAGRFARPDAGRLRRVIVRVIEGIPPTGAMLASTMVWTLATWLLKLGAFAWLLHDMARLDARTALLGAVGGEVSTVLPIHGIAGAGTYEAGVLAVLTPLRVALAAALPAAVNLHLFILGASILGVVPAALPPSRWREVAVRHDEVRSP